MPGNPLGVSGEEEGDLQQHKINDSCDRVGKFAGLDGVRLHDLSHSSASRALGQSLLMIGRLLGHSAVQTTERYAHLAADWVRESAVRILDSIADDILTGYSGQHATVTRHLSRLS